MGLAPVGAGWFKLLPNLINLRQTRTMRLMLWPLLLRPLERRRNKDRPRHDRCHVVMVQRHTPLSLVQPVIFPLAAVLQTHALRHRLMRYL